MIRSGADVELPTPQKLKRGAATAVGIAEAKLSGLCWSRNRKRYLGDILTMAATVTNVFCLSETQWTTNVYLKAYINFIRNFVTDLSLHFGGLLVTVFKTTRPLDQCGHRTNKKSEVILSHLMLTTVTTLCC